jgi:BASS family bile acid:Na+ symporter
MYLAMPLLAVAMALAFDLHPAVEIALVALAVSPVPPFLPLRAMKLGGAPDFIIGLLVAASALAIGLVPLAVALIARVFAQPYAVPAGTIAKLAALSVLVPLALGMALRRLAPLIADRIAWSVSVASMTTLAAGLLPVLLAAWHPILFLMGNGTVLAFAVFAAAGTAVGHLLGGPGAEERRMLALACGSRHPGIALAVAHANFPDDMNVLPAVLLYLVVGGLVTVPYLQWTRR